MTDRELQQLNQLNTLLKQYHYLQDNFKHDPSLDRQAFTQIVFEAWLTCQLKR
jgi:hypothetical protein